MHVRFSSFPKILHYIHNDHRFECVVHIFGMSKTSFLVLLANVRYFHKKYINTFYPYFYRFDIVCF